MRHVLPLGDVLLLLLGLLGLLLRLELLARLHLLTVRCGDELLLVTVQVSLRLRLLDQLPLEDLVVLDLALLVRLHDRADVLGRLLLPTLARRQLPRLLALLLHRVVRTVVVEDARVLGDGGLVLGRSGGPRALRLPHPFELLADVQRVLHRRVAEDGARGRACSLLGLLQTKLLGRLLELEPRCAGKSERVRGAARAVHWVGHNCGAAALRGFLVCSPWIYNPLRG